LGFVGALLAAPAFATNKFKMWTKQRIDFRFRKEMFNMAIWKVAIYEAVLLKHPNADALEILKLGGFQCVVAKAAYLSGQKLIFAPEKSVLPDGLAQPFRKYLGGVNKDRVKSVRLRGEFSEGVILELKASELELISGFDLGEDVSSVLGIVKYEPPIPTSLAGEVIPIADALRFRQHDVERFRLYESEFEPGEEVLVTEKLHGSQGVYYRNPNGQWFVTSKGLADRELALVDDGKNVYWKAAKNIGLFEHLDALALDVPVQVFGEVLKVQKGFDYGFLEPTLRVFRVLWDGVELEFDALDEFFKSVWVPIVFRGAFDRAELVMLAVGNETASGQARHIREGVVVSPITPRVSSEGFALFVKIINPAYKDDPEAFS
jgi:RNA ligase (TIGR02306 family)